MKTKYARLPLILIMHSACDKVIRSLLGLTLDREEPRTIISRICCNAARFFSPLATRLLGTSRRIRYLEQSRDVFHNFLKKEFSAEIERYKAMPLLPTAPDGKIIAPDNVPRTIWTLWWQGDEALSNLPRAARVCLKTMRGQKSFDTVVITQRNVADYIDISDVLPLFNEGRIKIQFLSDIIRMRLLKKHGGVWCDMGILFLDPSYLSDLADSYSFFSNKQPGGPLEHTSPSPFSLFFLMAAHSPAISFLEEMLTKFCLKYGTNFRYLLVDYCLMLEYREVPVAKQALDSVPFRNPDIKWLNGHWAECSKAWLAASAAGGGLDAILANNRMFKLSSRTPIDSAPEGSVWEEIEKRVVQVFGDSGGS